MRVLVIGGAGYIGSHVVKRCWKPGIQLRYSTIYRRDNYAIFSRVRNLLQEIPDTVTILMQLLPADLTGLYT